MIKPISERDYIGLGIMEAEIQAKCDGYNEVRIVEVDGVSRMLDMDVKSNRINVRIQGDRVIGAYTG